MVTYIKIGTCDELKEWGKYDPIPATTECCCCGTTVIDIITPNKDKPIVVPDKPKDDTPTNPSDNGGSNNGNTNPTTPTNPSDNGNNGNTDNGNTTPTNPSEQPTVSNHIFIEDADEGEAILFDFVINGKVGETVVLGDVIHKFYGDNINGGKINSEGNFEKDGIIYTSESIKPNLRDYVYTIKESGHDEEIPLKRTTKQSDNSNTGNTDTSTTQPTEQPTVLNQLTFEDAGDNFATLFDLTVRGKVGETVILGDVIQKEYGDNINGGVLNSDGNYEKDGIIYTIGSTPSVGNYYLKTYKYVIKENGYSEEIPLQRNKPELH